MKKIIKTSKAPAPIGPYNQAVLSGNTLYTSGQIAIDPSSGELKNNSIKEETSLVMENMKAFIFSITKEVSSLILLFFNSPEDGSIAI